MKELSVLVLVLYVCIATSQALIFSVASRISIIPNWSKDPGCLTLLPDLM